MSNEIKAFNRLGISGAPIVSEAQSAQFCHQNQGKYYSKNKEDMTLLRLKRMALNLERAMAFKQHRLYHLTKTAKTSCSSKECPSSSRSIGKSKGSRPSMHRTSRLRDAAPKTPRRQLSNDLPECSQEGSDSETRHVDNKWKDGCSAAKEPMSPPRRCNSDHETLTKLIERGILTCYSNQGTNDVAFHESAPELCYSFTFSEFMESTTIERLSNDDSSTDSSFSSANSVSTSSCDSDKDTNLHSGRSARTPTYYILQKVEEMGGDDKGACNKATFDSTASRFSSLFLNDEDASITSVSSLSTIRASNRSP